MSKVLLFFMLLSIGCSSQFNKGVTNKRELRSRKPPSVQIKEEYDKLAKKNSKKVKTYKSAKKQADARDKYMRKKKKQGDRYLRKKRKKQKKS